MNFAGNIEGEVTQAEIRETSIKHSAYYHMQTITFLLLFLFLRFGFSCGNSVESPPKRPEANPPSSLSENCAIAGARMK